MAKTVKGRGPAPERPVRRAALYVRVSSQDKQHPANQTRQLEQWAKEHGFKIVHRFIDRESGAEPDRPAFRSLFEHAAQRDFSLVLCWSLDRFSREGIAQTFQYLQRLRASDVEFYSYTEEYFRTTGPAADFLIAVTAWIADHERRRRRDRIQAGMERARAEGKWIGRKGRKFPKRQNAEMIEMAKRGVPLRQIARKLETSKDTIRRRLTAAGLKIDREYFRTRWTA